MLVSCLLDQHHFPSHINHELSSIWHYLIYIDELLYRHFHIIIKTNVYVNEFNGSWKVVPPPPATCCTIRSFISLNIVPAIHKRCSSYTYVAYVVLLWCILIRGAWRLYLLLSPFCVHNDYVFWFSHKKCLGSFSCI